MDDLQRTALALEQFTIALSAIEQMERLCSQCAFDAPIDRMMGRLVDFIESSATNNTRLVVADTLEDIESSFREHNRLMRGE